MTPYEIKKRIIRETIKDYVREHRRIIWIYTGISVPLLQSDYIKMRINQETHLTEPDVIMSLDDEKIPEIINDEIKTILVKSRRNHE